MSTVMEPPAGLAYYQVQRGGRSGWGRPLVGLILIGLCVFFVSPAVVLVGFEIFFLLTGQDVDTLMARVSEVGTVTPESLAFVLLSLAGAIPAAMLLCWALHGLRPGWLASVERRVRWPWLMQCIGIAAITMVVTIIIASRLPIPGEDVGPSTLNPYTSTMRDFVLVIVLLTPLQAAGEEYLFRGYIFQTFGALFGGMVGSRTVSVTITALLFAFAHGSQDLPLFMDRFAFGIMAGICVIATGGIEAGIAMHVLNNFFSLGMAVAFGDISTVLNTSEGSWWRIPVTLVQAGVFLALTVWAARSAGLATTTRAATR